MVVRGCTPPIRISLDGRIGTPERQPQKTEPLVYSRQRTSRKLPTAKSPSSMAPMDVRISRSTG